MTHRQRNLPRSLSRHLAAFGIAVAACLATGAAHAQAKAAAPAAAAAQLPNGANSLQETFGDWRLVCMVQEATKRCTLTQEQTSQQTRQRVLAIELGVNGDKMEGILLMPFGLALDRGTTLQIDDQAAQAPLRFRTCLPAGCLIPLSFDAKTVAALRSATALKAKVTPADNTQEQAFAISMKGFGTALDRLNVLMKG